MIKKSIVVLLVLVASTVVLSGCTRKDQPSSTIATSPQDATEQKGIIKLLPTLSTVNPETNSTQEVTQAPSFTIFVKAIEQSGLATELKSNTYTVLAPTDAAFNNLSKNEIDQLFSDPAMLEKMVQTHLIEGAYTQSELQQKKRITNLVGQQLTIAYEANTNAVTIAGKATVLEPNIRANNGIVHAIDFVFIP